jgi:hypothetical protein
MGKGSTPLLMMAAMMAVTGALVERNPFIGMASNGPSYKSIKHNKRRQGRKPR